MRSMSRGRSLAPLAPPRLQAASGSDPRWHCWPTAGSLWRAARRTGPPPSNLALVVNARLFDPATNTFSVSGALTSPRDRATATRLQDGRVLVFGGEGTAGWPDRGELYDPRTGLFSPTVPAGAGRVGHTATLLPNGKVLDRRRPVRGELDVWLPCGKRASVRGALRLRGGVRPGAAAAPHRPNCLLADRAHQEQTAGASSSNVNVISAEIPGARPR